MTNDVKRNPIKEFLFEYRGWILPLFLFNGGLFYLATDTAQESIGKGKEAIKAISWMVSAPVCEVNGFCHEINSNATVGEFVSATIRKEANIIHGDFSQIETTTGSYVVKGKVNGSLFKNSMKVTLHVKKGELENVLCINDNSCFLVPFNKNESV